MDYLPGQRKWPLWPVAGGRCGEVAVSEGSTVFVSEFIEYAWFATTSQGGHVGGQYKKIFLEEFT